MSNEIGLRTLYSWNFSGNNFVNNSSLIKFLLYKNDLQHTVMNKAGLSGTCRMFWLNLWFTTKILWKFLTFYDTVLCEVRK